MTSALQLSNSSLKELDLSNNVIQDSGVKQLCTGFKSPNCQLNVLRFVCVCTRDVHLIAAADVIRISMHGQRYDSLNMKQLAMQYDSPLLRCSAIRFRFDSTMCFYAIRCNGKNNHFYFFGSDRQQIKNELMCLLTSNASRPVSQNKFTK